MTSSTLNPAVLEPLFAPWQESNAHRVWAEKTGDPAAVKQGRRASPIEVVNNLRAAVREWREAFYIGASDTWLRLYQGQGLWDCARFAETQKFSSVS